MGSTDLRVGFEPDVRFTATSDVAQPPEQATEGPPSAARDAVVAAPPARFDATAAPEAPADFVTLVTQGGGTPQLAARLWTTGLTADEAKDALTLAMYSPRPERFGQARLLVEVLSWAMARGQVTAADVQAGFRGLRDAVVVQPDGLWVRASTGAPLQSSPVTMLGGRAYSGGLEVGGLYHSRGGVLRQVTPEGRAGEVVGELALIQDPVSAFVTGISKVLVDAAFGVGELAYGLVNAPEQTLTALFHAAGRVPEEAVRVAFESPEALERFLRLPAHEKAQVAGQIAASVLLAARAVRVAGAAGRAAGGAAQAVRVEIGLMELSTGGAVPWVRLHGMSRVLGAAGPGAPAGALGAVALRSRDGDLAEPKVRFANEHHVARRYGDPRVARPDVDEIARNLKALERGHPNTRATYAAQVREYLGTRTVSPEEIEAIHAAVKGWPEAARAELDAWVRETLTQAIADVEKWPRKLQPERIRALQETTKRVGLDYDALRASTVVKKAEARPRLIYEPNPKHGQVDRGGSSRAPSRPQWALDHSVEVSENSTRRVAVDPDNDEYLVFDEHREGRFHGHVRTWSGQDALDPPMQAALRRAGLVTKKGKIK